jgi:hypothetical protein
LRDVVDVVTIHEMILPLGAVVWAAVEKSPGFTPEGLIAEIRRSSHYPQAEWLKLLSSEPLDAKAIVERGSLWCWQGRPRGGRVGRGRGCSRFWCGWASKKKNPRG